ncbi:MAG: FliI/YscN family ATPase, partial [Lacunisphaera sp.]
MNVTVSPMIDAIRTQVRHLPTVQRLGTVTAVTGLIIESDGPNVGLGELCLLRSPRADFSVQAEVVGFREHRVLLMPLGETAGLHVGCEVAAMERPPLPKPGPEMLGRVLDALGRPFDGLGMLSIEQSDASTGTPPHPLRRQRITTPFPTGVRAIDAFVPIGRGQRLGLFAGSGVGKSTLLGMIARNSQADVVVVALVGERGREVREFLEKDLGTEGLKRSIVVVATSDQPAPLRLRAAFTATSIAEAWRNQGKNVLLLMDSVTRFAMAQREIGLAIGEPPATRGYTPSVFAMLPRLLERSGAGETGAITAIYTVLVEGDDMNEPVADAVRGILDGHLVLSRNLAHFNHYPAIDVLESVSRLTRDICTPEEVA